MPIGLLEHTYWKKVSNIPYKSEKQRKYFHTKSGMKKVGKKVVEEFDEEERKKRKKKRGGK